MELINKPSKIINMKAREHLKSVPQDLDKTMIYVEDKEQTSLGKNEPSLCPIAIYPQPLNLDKKSSGNATEGRLPRIYLPGKEKDVADVSAKVIKAEAHSFSDNLSSVREAIQDMEKQELDGVKKGLDDIKIRLQERKKAEEIVCRYTMPLDIARCNMERKIEHLTKEISDMKQLQLSSEQENEILKKKEIRDIVQNELKGVMEQLEALKNLLQERNKAEENEVRDVRNCDTLEHPTNNFPSLEEFDTIEMIETITMKVGNSYISKEVKNNSLTEEETPFHKSKKMNKKLNIREKFIKLFGSSIDHEDENKTKTKSSEKSKTSLRNTNVSHLDNINNTLLPSGAKGSCTITSNDTLGSYSTSSLIESDGDGLNAHVNPLSSHISPSTTLDVFFDTAESISSGGIDSSEHPPATLVDFNRQH